MALKRIPIVAIVGRPNVGKSTLFNRVLGEKKAIVEDRAGVTRDRNYALVERFSIPFFLVDTGGFELNSEDLLKKAVTEQAQLAAEEADAILCLFDGKAGLHPEDPALVSFLRQIDTPVYYLVNKCDGAEQGERKYDFFSLGLEELGDCSALHGYAVDSIVSGVLSDLPEYPRLLQSAEDLAKQADLYELELESELEQVSHLPKVSEEEEFEDPEEELPLAVNQAPQFAPVWTHEQGTGSADEYLKTNRLRSIGKRLKPVISLVDQLKEEVPEEAPAKIDCIQVAILGRPNAGKSTLVNRLCGEERAITSPVAGTTRDTLDLEITREGQKFLLLDTAGLRRKARISDNVERYAVMRALSAASTCDVGVLVLDAERGPEEQDAKILGILHERGCGIVIAVNKWDALEKDHRSVQKFTEEVRHAFKFAPYAPLVFLSAKTGRRCPKLIETVQVVAYERQRRIPTAQLNAVLERSFKRHSAPRYRGRPIKLYYSSQVDTAPPRFALFLNYPRAVHFSFLRFLRNEIRQHFGFEGTDIKFLLRKR